MLTTSVRAMILHRSLTDILTLISLNSWISVCRSPGLISQPRKPNEGKSADVLQPQLICDVSLRSNFNARDSKH